MRRWGKQGFSADLVEPNRRRPRTAKGQCRAVHEVFPIAGDLWADSISTVTMRPRWQTGHWRAMMALAPRTLQNIPERFRRDPTTALQPASITPEPTNSP